MSQARHVIGIDLGGTNMQIGVVTPDGKILGRSKKKTKADEGADAVLGRMVQGIEEALKEAGESLGDMQAVGIGSPGAIDFDTGVVIESPNLRWNHFPLASELSKKLKGLPVIVTNDVKAAVWGEYRVGAGVGAKHMMGVWLGTGVGGAFILNGQLFTGHWGTAGEIGHISLFPLAPMGTRSLEQNCSRTAVVDRLVKLIRQNHASILAQMHPDGLGEIKSSEVAEAYRKGDKLTCAVVDEAADLLGIAIASAVTMLSIPLIVLGGGLTEAMGQPLVNRVQSAARERVFPRICADLKVVGTKLEDNAGLLGAAIWAQEKMG